MLSNLRCYRRLSIIYVSLLFLICGVLYLCQSGIVVQSVQAQTPPNRATAVKLTIEAALTPSPTANYTGTVAAEATIAAVIEATLTALAPIPVASPTATATQTSTPTTSSVNVDATVAAAIAATLTALVPATTTTPTVTEQPQLSQTQLAQTVEAKTIERLTALAPTVTSTHTRTSTPTATRRATATRTRTPTSTPVPQPSIDITDLIGDRDPKTLNILYWQAVSILNPYLASGTKDFHAGSLILEPLAHYTPDGVLVPALASEIPTLDNGGVSEDLRSVTWQLKDDVVWSDGTPVTANDVVFTWQYCSTPETGCASATNYEGVANVEVVDDLTVLITFDAPKPFPYSPFTGMLAPILQKAQFENCVGAAAQGCSAQNNAPIGTGPFKVVEFRANDVVTYERNTRFREIGKPYFDKVIFKGGGDAVSAARSVLETGEMDYAWNLQVVPDILTDMESTGKGTLVTAYTGNVERILINFTNPDPALGPRRSEWAPGNPNAHPFLTNATVRKALSMAIDRNIIAEQLYGPAGRATCNILAGPPSVVSFGTRCDQDINGAKKLLDDTGIVDTNGDGVRELNGIPLRILYQTSTNSVRQKTQALIKQWWAEIGVTTELRNIDAGVFFGGDPNSPDTLGKFYTDVEMFTNGPVTTDPQSYLAGWLCNSGENIAQSENDYYGNNTERWCSDEYDAVWNELAATADPAQRSRLAIQLNDMLHNEYVNLPLVFRSSVSAHSNTIKNVQINGWDSELWNIEDWKRID